jgi:hypothetical protein
MMDAQVNQSKIPSFFSALKASIRLNAPTRDIALILDTRCLHVQ